MLLNFYYKTVVSNLMLKLNYNNIMQIPTIKKITLNMGVGDTSDKNNLKHAMNDLMLISGQKPFITKAKKSIANFKIRQGNEIGCKVTLRKKMMWYFLERLLFIVLPRIKDFRGLPVQSFDGKGNYNFGIKEQIIFPEINYDKIDKIRGLDICITTTAINNFEGFILLSEFKFPFKKGHHNLCLKNQLFKDKLNEVS